MKSDACINSPVMRGNRKKSIAKLMTRTFYGIYFRTLGKCRAMSINTDICELLILRENVKTSHFHDAIEMGNICFMLERKSGSDLQSSEVFDDILFG